MQNNFVYTDHDRRELSRCAQAMYARGRNDLGHLLSAVAANPEPALRQFMRAMDVYRAWLVFDEPKVAAPFVDVSTVTEYGLTQKLSNSVRVF